jgi:hypothetical protein
MKLEHITLGNEGWTVEVWYEFDCFKVYHNGRIHSCLDKVEAATLILTKLEEPDTAVSRMRLYQLLDALLRE